MRGRSRIVIPAALGLVFGIVAPGNSDAQEAEPDQTVLLTNIEFKPNRIKVSVGDTIRFINKDKFDHDVYLVRTANRNDVITPATTIHAGQSAIVTINQEGLFTLYCTIHGGMTGKVTTTDTFELTEEEKKRAAARNVVPPIVKVGEELYWGRAQCHRCHRMGKRGESLRGPNHQDLGFRAAARAEKLGMSSATEYIVQSILEPSAHIVEGYSDDMPKVYQPPINLGEEEIRALVAYLQSQGGEVDSWSINLNPQTLATPLEPTPFRRGDPRRGEKVFEELGCGSCHTVGDKPAISIAPDLTAIGAYRNWTWLAQSVIDPNAEIGANWRDAIVYLKPGVFLQDDEEEEEDEEPFQKQESLQQGGSQPNEASRALTEQLVQLHAEMTRLRERMVQLEQQKARVEGHEMRSADVDDDDVALGDRVDNDRTDTDMDFDYGETVRGVLRSNSTDEVTMLVGPNRLETFPQDQVAAVVMAKLSRMASNYGEFMTFRQMSDLMSYLESLKGPTTEASH